MGNNSKTNKKFMCLSVVGIIMVVDVHSGTSIKLFTSLFPYNSFFMPMFVFISGYFNTVNQGTSLGDYIKKKSKNLMLPYFCITLVASLVEWLMECCKYGSVSAYSLKRYPLAILSVFTSGEITTIASPLWFVPSLFAVQLVYALLKKTFYAHWNSKLVLILLCLINVFVVWYAKNIGVTAYTMMFLKVFFFLPFMEFGILYRDVLEKKLERSNHLLLLLILMFINMGRMMLEQNDILYINLSSLSGFPSPNPATPLISSVIGILFWTEMVSLFGPPVYENRTINYISENTFFVMGFHVIFFNILNCILLAVNNYFPLPGFSVSEFQKSTWYRWDYYPGFLFAYFAFGLLGSLALKLLYDRLRNRILKKG